MITCNSKRHLFELIPENRDKILNWKTDWIENPIGLVTLYRTYLRKKRNGQLENWNECVLRVIEGMFSFQKTHVINSGLIWDEEKAQRTAMNAAERLFEFKWTPPGRGLWMMGTDFVWEKGGAALNNPLHVDTMILTKEKGWCRIGDFNAGDEITVLSSEKLYGRDHTSNSNNSIWVNATVSQVEIHPTKKINYIDNDNNKFSCIASDNHRWFRKKKVKEQWERVTTLDLQKGDYLPRITENNHTNKKHEERFKVVSIDDCGQNEVMCVTVPYYEQFVINGGLLTSNCGFVSTIDIDQTYSEPFRFLMDMSMLGVGVGFDTRGAGKLTVRKPSNEIEVVVVEDTREGWVNLLGSLIDSYLKLGGKTIQYDVSKVRLKGEPIRGFGGVASGPGALVQGFYGIRDLLESNIGKKLSSVMITDIQNLIGKVVIAGNVRRCLPEDTLVLVGPEQWKSMSEITEHDQVYINNSYYTIKENVYQGEQEVVKICLEDGSYLESTEKHKWFVFDENSNELTWVMAKDLTDHQYFVSDKSATDDYVFVRVKFTEYTGNVVKTRDIVVNSDDHAFIAKHPVGLGIGISHNTAEIAFGEANDSDFRTMKSWQANPLAVGVQAPDELKLLSEEDYQIYSENMYSPVGTAIVQKYENEPWAYKFGGWRWASNNSIFATVGMDYTEIANSIAENGEPGLAWLENMQNYSRMNNGPDYKDTRALGGNPCFRGDTLIAVADGRVAVSIKELAESGDDVPVYSINRNTGMVEIQWGRCPRKTRENSSLVKVILEDDSELVVTPDHGMLLLNGEKVEAQHLQPGDSLPRFSKKNQGKHLRVYTNTRNRNKDIRFEHNMVVKFKSRTSFNKKDSETVYFKEDFERTSEQMKELRSKKYQEYYLEQAAKTDLKTIWLDNKLYAVKECDNCKTKMVLPWRARHTMFCSTSCQHEKLKQDVNFNKKRNRNQRKFFNDRYMNILHNQIMIFKDLEKSFNRVPLQKEWKQECKTQNISCRINKHSKNPFVLKNYNELKEKSRDYNHRVKEVVFLNEKEDVYNLTVDENYTVGLVLKYDSIEKTCEGIFTTQCLEQTLESKELCCLVETYPSRHQSARDFYETLKVAYLYAKTVTLIATHNEKTNTVICRNRRIGTSQSGIIDAIYKFGRHYYQKNMLDAAYDKLRQYDVIYSEWLGIPKSIKIASVKPSGCSTPDGRLKVVNNGVVSYTTYEELFKLAEIDLNSCDVEQGTWILPEQNLLPKVVDHNNELQNIIGLFVNGVDEVYEIEFEDGNIYKFTGEHKLMTTSGEWKRVDELTEDDEIMSY